MAKVDREQMEATLDALQEVGVVRAWQRRPLGVYHLDLTSGDRLTPDTKEAAMWVMGASAVVAQYGDRWSRELPPGLDPEFVGGALDEFVRLGHLTAWELDGDGDYALRSEDDPDYPLYFGAHVIVPFIGGMASAIRSAERITATPRAAHSGDGPAVLTAGGYELVLVGEELTLLNDDGDELPPRSAWPVIADESDDLLIAIAHEQGLLLVGQDLKRMYEWATVQSVDWASASTATITLTSGTVLALRPVMRQYTPDFCEIIDYVLRLARDHRY